MSDVAIFWDYENCSPPSNATGLGYDIVRNISRIARLFGSVTTFRAYLDISAQSLKSVLLRSELQSSGVSMIDCPHNGRKDVVDKMILVDMLAFAVDHPAPATFILITGDRDYAYAVSTLKLRRYQVILVVPSSPHTSPSLESQASLVIDWGAAILRTRSDAVNPSQAVRQPYFGVDANIVTKLLRELQDAPLNDPDPTYSNASQTTLQLRRISTRDLLEPSRRCKDPDGFDATLEFNDSPASSRKSASTRSDPTLGGLAIPTTPSRSRRASISAGSTWARSATVVAPSPPAVEWDTPAKNPPPCSARRSNASDITDAVGPAKHSPPSVPPLDTARELPSDDSRPPSSIVVRSPFEARQPIPVSGNPQLNSLASPFDTPRTLTGSRSTASPNPQQSPTAVGPTSPLAQTKMLSETVTSVDDIEVPKGAERPDGSRLDDNDTNPGRSLPHPYAPSNHGPRDGTDTPKSNYHLQYAPHTICSPSSRNVGVHPTDSPSNQQVSPPAAGVGDAVDAQLATSARDAPSTPGRAGPGPEPVLSSSAFPSTPSLLTTTPSYESRQRETWTMFKPLIDILLAAQERGIIRPTRSMVALDLVQSCKHVYQRAGVTKFREYTALAEQAGVIELGGVEGGAWIALHPDWLRADGIASTSFPTSNPLHAIQSPLLAGLKTPPMERAAIVHSPSVASPKFSSPENSTTFPTSPTDGRDAAPRACIPPQFQPLIDILVKTRADGIHWTLRSVVGQLLSQEVYARAGVSGFKEYVHQASEAQLVQFGGVGGHAWIRLHPNLRV